MAQRKEVRSVARAKASFPVQHMREKHGHREEAEDAEKYDIT